MFSSTSHADWKKVSENLAGNTHYVDFERVRKNDGYVYYWSLYNYSRPAVNGDRSVKLYAQGDCENFRFRWLKLSVHKVQMGLSAGNKQEPLPENKGWGYPSPDIVNGLILKAVCDHVKALSDELNWSQMPSAHERELKKRHNNTLYKPPRRHVTQKDIDAAIQKDRRNSDEAQAAISLFEKQINLSGSFGELRKIMKLIQPLDHLITLTTEIGGNLHLENFERLIDLRSALVAKVREGLKDSPQELKMFEKAEKDFANIAKFRSKFVSQLIGKDKPILMNEVVPSLLSEPISEIKNAVKLIKQLNYPQFLQLREAVRALTSTDYVDIENIPRIDEKMAVFGVGRN